MAAKDHAFVELPPLRREVRPRVTDLDAPVQNAIARHDRLPSTGPGVTTVISAGPRLMLQPSDRRAALMLAAAGAQLGQHYDHKRNTHVEHLTELRRRGVANFQGFSAIMQLTGVALDVPAATAATVARQRRALARQMRPIERTIWRDEHANAKGELVEATNLRTGIYWGSTT